jgi:hypothetical protein
MAFVIKKLHPNSMELLKRWIHNLIWNGSSRIHILPVQYDGDQSDTEKNDLDGSDRAET